MLTSSLCDYSDVHILVKGKITISGAGAKAAAKQTEVIFKKCTPFTDCINEINNTQVDNAKDLHVLIPMYNVIEYSNNVLKTSGSLWQY